MKVSSSPFLKSMKIGKIIDIHNQKELFELWNQEYQDIYPISSELWERNIENIDNDASFVAYINNEIVGFIIGKTWCSEFIIDGYLHTGWVSLIFVKKAYRRKKIGTTLLHACIDAFHQKQKDVIYLGRDVHNFFPGLPVDFVKSMPFFEKNGFEYSYQTFDLINRNEKKLPLKNINSSFHFRKATIDDKEDIINFLNYNWPGRWTYEAIEYFNKGGNGSEYLLSINNKNEICAFVKVCYPLTKIQHISNSFTWHKRFKALGGIGPLGVTPAYRGIHLGYDIVAYAVNTLIDASATELIIDWTGLIEFYRGLGFEVWKSYYYLTKKIRKEN